MNNNPTINGLTDGVSVVEKDNKNYGYLEAVTHTDILYNDQKMDENVFQDLYREEGLTVSDYDPELFNESINLLSVSEETINVRTEDDIFS